MVSQLTVEAVTQGDEYHHVVFREPDSVGEIRTPDWAKKPAGAVVAGSEVRMGRYEGEWLVQSVLVPIDGVDDEEDAAQKATSIASKISD